VSTLERRRRIPATQLAQGLPSPGSGWRLGAGQPNDCGRTNTPLRHAYTRHASLGSPMYVTLDDVRPAHEPTHRPTLCTVQHLHAPIVKHQASQTDPRDELPHVRRAVKCSVRFNWTPCKASHRAGPSATADTRHTRRRETGTRTDTHRHTQLSFIMGRCVPIITSNFYYASRRDKRYHDDPSVRLSQGAAACPTARSCPGFTNKSVFSIYTAAVNVTLLAFAADRIESTAGFRPNWA